MSAILEQTITNADDVISTTARMRAMCEIEEEGSRSPKAVYPSAEMNMGELEDFMSSPDARIRVAALRQAFYKGKLEGLNAWGDALKVSP